METKNLSSSLMVEVNEWAKKLSYDSEFLSADDMIGLPCVIIGIEVDDKDRDRYCQVMHVPLNEELDYYRLYQFLVVLPFSKPDTSGFASDQINLLLSKINTIAPIGSFSVNHVGQIIYRFVHFSSEADPMTIFKFEDVFDIGMFTLDIYQDDIEAVYNKEIDAKKALENINNRFNLNDED